MAAIRQEMNGAVRVLCALALLFLSFAHLPAFATASMPGQTAEYRLPDGTFASLCLTHSGDEKPATALICDLCCLTLGTYLSLPQGGKWQALDLESLSNPLFALQAVEQGHGRERPRSRSPPQVV